MIIDFEIIWTSGELGASGGGGGGGGGSSGGGSDGRGGGGLGIIGGGPGGRGGTNSGSLPSLSDSSSSDPLHNYHMNDIEVVRPGTVARVAEEIGERVEDERR